MHVVHLLTFFGKSTKYFYETWTVFVFSLHKLHLHLVPSSPSDNVAFQFQCLAIWSKQWMVWVGVGFALEGVGLFSRRTGMSLDDSTHSTNTSKYGQTILHTHYHVMYPSFCQISIISGENVMLLCYSYCFGTDCRPYFFLFQSIYSTSCTKGVWGDSLVFNHKLLAFIILFVLIDIDRASNQGFSSYWGSSKRPWGTSWGVTCPGRNETPTIISFLLLYMQSHRHCKRNSYQYIGTKFTKSPSLGL